MDTNVVLRGLASEAKQFPSARVAMRKLRRHGHRLCIFPQTVLELWSVSTRPKPPAGNGLGLEIVVAQRYLRFVEGFFDLLQDEERIYGEWRRLVIEHRVIGRQVFDARLVACMLVHGVPRVLTYDVSDFRRFPEIEVVNPEQVEKLLG